MERKTKIALVLVVLIIAAFFRFYRIAEIPPGLYPDEAVNGNNAAEALESGGFKVFYPDNNGREGLFINLQAISIALFGAEPWALRFVSAVFGTLTVLGIYLLAKELYREKPEVPNPKPESSPNVQMSTLRVSSFRFRVSQSEMIALLSSFFLATSYWHINFSRIGFRAIMVPFFAVFGIYWLMKALRTGKIFSAVLAGVFIGLGFHTYIAFRFMPLVLMAPIIFSLAQWRRSRSAASSVPIDYPIDTDRHPCAPCVIALFLFIAFVAALPIGLYFLDHPWDFFGRGGQISIFSAESPLKEFVKSNALTLGMFNVWGDCNPRHNLNCAPELFWPVGILFIVGFFSIIRSAFNGLRKSQSSNPKPEEDPNAQNAKFLISAKARWARPFRGFEFRVSRVSAWLLLAWFIFMMLPATLTREGLPHALRSIGLIPPVMIFAGLGAARLFTHAENYFESFIKNPAWSKYHSRLYRIKKEIAVLLFVILLAVLANTYRAYFQRFHFSPKTAEAFRSELLAMARYANERSPNTRVYFIANYPNLYYGLPIETQVLQFITETRTPESRRDKNIIYVMPEEIDNLLMAESRNARIVIIPMRQDDLDTFKYIKKRLPALSLKTRVNFLTLEN